MATREEFYFSFFDEFLGACRVEYQGRKTGRRIMAFKGCVGDYWITYGGFTDLLTFYVCFFAEFR